MNYEQCVLQVEGVEGAMIVTYIHILYQWLTLSRKEYSTSIRLSSTGPEIYSVVVEACDLMLSHGADTYAKDGEGLVARDLMKKVLLKPIAGLIPARDRRTSRNSKGCTSPSLCYLNDQRELI